MCMPDLHDFKDSLTPKEREEFRQFNGNMLNDLWNMTSRVVDAALKPSAAEQCGMTETDYKQAESLYLHGDLSGK